VTCLADGTYASDAVDCSASGGHCLEGACHSSYYSQDFESGQDTDWFNSFYLQRFNVTDATAANGSHYSLFVRTGAAGSGMRAGYLYRSFDNDIKPSRISFWVRVAPASGNTAIPVIHFSGTKGGVLEVAVEANKITMADMARIQDHSFTVTPNTWHHVVVGNLDWALNSTTNYVTFSVDGATPAYVYMDKSMVARLGPALRQITIQTNGFDTWWDEFLFE
jgi:hypothetical protein